MEMTRAPGNAWAVANFSMSMQQGKCSFAARTMNSASPLLEMTLADLRANNRHKACEPGCALGCARLVSHALGEPPQTLQTSLTLVSRIRPPAKPVTALSTSVTPVKAPSC